MPFPVKAIQVDGGSEFMAEFEAACQAKGVALYVLPPRSPQMNGAVKRCNGAWRDQFYETYELPEGVERHRHVATRRARADYNGCGFQAAATTSRHVLIAAARSARCV